jgi:hypothetical protein
MKQIMKITDVLCQALQQKKARLCQYHDFSLNNKVIDSKIIGLWMKTFTLKCQSILCTKNIDIPDLKAQYTRAHGRSHHQSEVLITVEHHFKVDIFIVAIGFQLQELDGIFCDQIIELLILRLTLCPQDSYNSFNVDDECNLA